MEQGPLDVIAEPNAPITANGYRLIGGERVGFARSINRFRHGRVLSVDGNFARVQLGEHPPRRQVLEMPAGWLELEQ